MSGTATGIVAAMRNLAGFRLTATARYQPSEDEIAGSLQTQSWSKLSIMSLLSSEEMLRWSVRLVQLPRVAAGSRVLAGLSALVALAASGMIFEQSHPCKKNNTSSEQTFHVRILPLLLTGRLPKLAGPFSR